MPLLNVHRLAPGFTEYRVTSDANNFGLLACIVLFAQSIVSTVRQLDYQAGTLIFQAACGVVQAALAWRLQLLVQIICWVASVLSAYCWVFAARYESVTVVKGLALQLQCTLRCGLSHISCYDIEQVQDVLIWEHVSTTDVKFYLAFKVAGQEDLVVAYKSLLPRLAVLQPVYRELLLELACQRGRSGQHSTA